MQFLIDENIISTLLNNCSFVATLIFHEVFVHVDWRYLIYKSFDAASSHVF